MIREATRILSGGQDLNSEQMRLSMEEIMQGQATTRQTVSFLIALNKKGETPGELTAAVYVMRRYATKIKTRHKTVLDTCGTGADTRGTFNISTVSAFVASGCGIAVAKHGNRSVSSRCGSADVLEALGVNINLGQAGIERCLDDIGIAFLFAPSLHPAMKYAMPARKQIRTRTIFNLLGPLTNPAGATHQLIGVFDTYWAEVLARVLANLRVSHALVVHGQDGLDEITTTENTYIAETQDGRINSYKIRPQDFGLRLARPQDLAGSDASGNARILLEVLGGAAGPKRDIVVLNAAAAIYAADAAKSIAEAIGMASASIDSGQALKKLELLKEYSQKK